MTNGRTKVSEQLMDGIAILSEQIGATGELLRQIDLTIRADLDNDPDMKAADDHLARALELDEGDDRQASMLQAQRALRIAMQKDFSDTTKEALRGMVIPHQEKLERCRERMRGVMAALHERPRRAKK